MSSSNAIVLIVARAQVNAQPPKLRLSPQTLQPPQLIRPATDISDQNKQDAIFFFGSL
jgi:hypothetical protein